MHLNRTPNRAFHPQTAVSAVRRTRTLWAGGLASLVAIVFLTGAAQQGQQPSANPDQASMTSIPGQPPDANDHVKPPEQQAAARTALTAGGEHKRQISDDSARLLTLAMALKAEVDKTNKDTLSLNVIRKADEIEKLAHSVRDKMKVTVGGS